jgi:glutaredoxin 3
VPSRVILFSTDSCTFCVHAKSLLCKRGVAFEEVNLAQHPELQAELVNVTGLTSSPQIIVGAALARRVEVEFVGDRPARG